MQFAGEHAAHRGADVHHLPALPVGQFVGKDARVVCQTPNARHPAPPNRVRRAEGELEGFEQPLIGRHSGNQDEQGLLFHRTPEGTSSGLAHELGLQPHGAEAVDLAGEVVVAFDEADVLDFRAGFDGLRGAFDREVFDDHHVVAVR